MPRRAFRILCLLAFAGSAGLWARSYFSADVLALEMPRRVVCGLLSPGALMAGWEHGSSHWRIDLERNHKEHGQMIDEDRFPRPVCGFGIWSDPYRDFFVRIPLWCPTLASALLSLWLWHRGRRRQGGRGFPVEQPPEVQFPA